MADQRKPHWRTVIKRMDPDYLYAEDLGGPGTTVDVEIVDSGRCRVKNPGGTKETLFIAFKGKSKKLGLNATNCKTLTNICGSDHWGDWRGWITLVVIHKRMRDPTTEEIEDMDVIRIAPERPRKASTGPASRSRSTGAETSELTPEELDEIKRREAQEGT
jgi:hypothetical protein